ncbi:MAG: N-acetyltransferase family protein [Coriobacteriia bacterium]|nr:N-acetyltransferase family protein [Coriobacteriia bacterium]
MNEPAIRPAVPADAADISRIYNQAVLNTTATFDTEPETVGARERWLAAHADPGHPVLVATLGGAIVGWASLSTWSDRCAYAASVEASTYVDETMLGRGIGTALSAAVLEAGRAAGVHAVLSRICTENEASIRMSKKLGFVEVGVLHEVGRKFDRWLDVMMLEKLL